MYSFTPCSNPMRNMLSICVLQMRKLWFREIMYLAENQLPCKWYKEESDPYPFVGGVSFHSVMLLF